MNSPPQTMIDKLPSKDEFLHKLKENTGIIVLKFGASWCKPCKQIEEFINHRFDETGEHVLCGKIDIDNEENFEVYAFLKKKKIVQSIPTVLRYDCGNVTYIPDDIVTGTDIPTLEAFFEDLNN